MKGILNLKCLSIEFVVPNLSQVYFCMPENFKTNFSNRFGAQNYPLNLCSCAANNGGLQLGNKALLIFRADQAEKDIMYRGRGNTAGLVLDWSNLEPSERQKYQVRALEALATDPETQQQESQEDSQVDAPLGGRQQRIDD